jgi:hypothetical protein
LLAYIDVFAALSVFALLRAPVALLLQRVDLRTKPQAQGH